MQERCGEGTEAKLSNLINQLEELLFLIKEGTKMVFRSQSPQPENLPDTIGTMQTNEQPKLESHHFVLRWS